MQTSCAYGQASSLRGGVNNAAKARFRLHFQRALRTCLRHQFTLAEAFGMVFEETLQEVAVEPSEEAELFAELLGWARAQTNLSSSCSSDFFTSRSR